MHRYIGLPLLAAALAILDGGNARAQGVPTSPPAAQITPSAPNSATCPTDARPHAQTDGSAQSNLSDKLASQNGVLCPPAGVDPQMQGQPPAGGSLRVVPPPGTPGGNPNSIPK